MPGLAPGIDVLIARFDDNRRRRFRMPDRKRKPPCVAPRDTGTIASFPDAVVVAEKSPLPRKARRSLNQEENRMTFWIDMAAARFANAEKDLEKRQEADGVDFTEQRVRLAIVHTRQDVVLLAYHLSSISSSLWVIKACVLLATAVYVLQPWLKPYGWLGHG
jgi:hypothetical protein